MDFSKAFNIIKNNLLGHARYLKSLCNGTLYLLEHIIDMGAVEEVGKRKRTGRKGWNESRGVQKVKRGSKKEEASRR